MSNPDRRNLILAPVFAAVLLSLVWVFSGQRFGESPNSLIVYCAHDSVYADQILKDFERQTGIRVDVRYDTEATKSLGLINLIVQEQQYPRCDVFWNNELLGMVDLQSQGLVEPYQGSAWKRLPAQYRDEQGAWIGFGARFRVVAFHTPTAAADPGVAKNILEVETARAAVAKPIFGTTLTHYTILWDEWGAERVKEWHRELRLRGIREVNGNGPVKDMVAQGICDVGFTDTDDVFVGIDDKQPIEMLPVRISVKPEKEEPHESEQSRFPAAISAMNDFSTGPTICIPNTAAIIRGTKRLAAAQKLIDFLGSAEAELALARSKSRQVPLGPVDDAQLPDDVRKMVDWAKAGYDLRPLLPVRRACLEWLKSEYAR